MICITCLGFAFFGHLSHSDGNRFGEYSALKLTATGLLHVHDCHMTAPQLSGPVSTIAWALNGIGFALHM